MERLLYVSGGVGHPFMVHCLMDILFGLPLMVHCLGDILFAQFV